MPTRNPKCEDCKLFSCTGYHSYHCFKDDDNPEPRSPFDNICNEFDDKR